MIKWHCSFTVKLMQNADVFEDTGYKESNTQNLEKTPELMPSSYHME